MITIHPNSREIRGRKQPTRPPIQIMRAPTNMTMEMNCSRATPLRVSWRQMGNTSICRKGDQPPLYPMPSNVPSGAAPTARPKRRRSGSGRTRGWASGALSSPTRTFIESDKKRRPRRVGRTSRITGNVLSLNHLVRALQQRLRDGDAERLCGLQVDHQLELGGLLHRDIAGPGALENLVDEAGCPAPMPRVG